MNRLPPEGFSNFGTEGNVGFNAGDIYHFPNDYGYSFATFHLVIPTGATVVFEGTLDGTHWMSMSMLNLDTGLPAVNSTISGNFSGIVAGYQR